MKNLLRLTVFFAVCLSSVGSLAQQAEDAAPTQPGDGADVITQIQQLRADLERLTQQVDRLNAEIRGLQSVIGTAARTPSSRTSRTSTQQPAPAPASAAPAAPRPPASHNDETIPVTVLVLKDKRTVETRNYAIVGENIWVYSEDESKRYPLQDLDVDATKKINSERGVSFQLPPAR